MKHGHADRIAERAPDLCAAYGCPLVGTSCGSTQGSTEWWCCAHFGLDFGQMQRATAELNRCQWLVGAVRSVRNHSPGTVASREAYAEVQQSLADHGRLDLQHKARESRQVWLGRLEGELVAIVRASVQPNLYEAAPAGANLQPVGVLDMPS